MPHRGIVRKRRLRPAVVPAGIAGRMRDGDQHGPPSTASRAGRARPRRARGRRRAVGGPIGQDGRATPLASPSHCRRTAELPVADARSARRAAEKVARRRWPAAWSGPPASRGWRRPARQVAADALAAPAEAGRQLVQAAEAAALWDRAQAEVATADAGYALSLIHI